MGSFRTSSRCCRLRSNKIHSINCASDTITASSTGVTGTCIGTDEVGIRFVTCVNAVDVASTVMFSCPFYYGDDNMLNKVCCTQAVNGGAFAACRCGDSSMVMRGVRKTSRGGLGKFVYVSDRRSDVGNQVGGVVSNGGSCATISSIAFAGAPFEVKCGCTEGPSVRGNVQVVSANRSLAARRVSGCGRLYSALGSVVMWERREVGGGRTVCC